MCVKLSSGNLNPALTPHTPQALILVEWPSYQGCVVVNSVNLSVYVLYLIFFFLEWFYLFILLFVLKRTQTIFCMWKNMGHIRLMQLKRPRKGYRFGNPCRTTCYDPNSIQPKPKPNWPNSFSKSKKDMTFQAIWFLKVRPKYMG